MKNKLRFAKHVVGTLNESTVIVGIIFAFITVVGFVAFISGDGLFVSLARVSLFLILAAAVIIVIWGVIKAILDIRDSVACVKEQESDLKNRSGFNRLMNYMCALGATDVRDYMVNKAVLDLESGDYSTTLPDGRTVRFLYPPLSDKWTLFVYNHETNDSKVYEVED